MAYLRDTVIAKMSSIFKTGFDIRWSRRLIAIASLLAAMASTAIAEDFTDEELAYGKDDRVQQIRSLADAVDIAEANKRRTRDRAEKEALTKRVSELKRALNEVKRKTPEDFARARRERLEEERRQVTAMEQQKAREAEADAERMKVSGNCPLRIDFATFAHLTDVRVIALFHRVDATTTLGLTPLTAVVLEVTNRSPQEVEAWEMSYELLDGFDEVLYTGDNRNPLVAPGEQAKIRVSAPHVPEAVQMRIYVQRVKSKDDAVWERKPEFQQVGVTVRKLEGADFMKRDRR